MDGIVEEIGEPKAKLITALMDEISGVADRLLTK